MTPYWDNGIGRLYQADALSLPLKDESVDCCVTSPPYFGLRDYGHEGQIGQEETMQDYVCNLVDVFREVRRVMKPQATLWLNLGDSYAGSNKGYMADGTVAAGAKQATNRGTVAIAPELVRGKRVERGPGSGRWGGGDVAVSGLKAKDLMMIPARVALALQEDGWYLRSEITWCKKNPMPESVQDRPTSATEKLFLLTKQPTYYYDAAAIREPATWSTEERQGRALIDHKYMPPEQRHGIRPRKTDKQRGHGRVHAGFNDRWDSMTKAEQGALVRNKRNYWLIATEPFPEKHFAVYPEALIEPCILAGCPEGGTVLDPFMGSGTTGAVAQRLGRRWVGCDLSEAYLRLAAKRIGAVSLPLPL